MSVHSSGRTFHSPHPNLLSTSHCILLSQYQGTCADNLLALLGFGNIRYSVIIYVLYYPSFWIYWLLILNGRFLLVFFLWKMSKWMAPRQLTDDDVADRRRDVSFSPSSSPSAASVEVDRLLLPDPFPWVDSAWTVHLLQKFPNCLSDCQWIISLRRTLDLYFFSLEPFSVG